MKRNWMRSVTVAAILIGSAPVWAHDECDEEENKVAGSANDESPRLPTQSAAKVTIKLFQYQPARLQVNAGTTVTWLNEDEIFHTVSTERPENGFNGSLDGKGRSFSFTFSQPGIYAYYCDRHEHMRGEIEVR